MDLQRCVQDGDRELWSVFRERMIIQDDTWAGMINLHYCQRGLEGTVRSHLLGLLQTCLQSSRMSSVWFSPQWAQLQPMQVHKSHKESVISAQAAQVCFHLVLRNWQLTWLCTHCWLCIPHATPLHLSAFYTFTSQTSFQLPPGNELLHFCCFSLYVATSPFYL